MKERTVNRPIGFVADGVAPGSTHAHGLSGIRYRCSSESLKRCVEHLDVGDVLDPVGAEVTGHDQSQWIAVQERQLRAVHLPGQHDLAVAGMVDVERLDEVRPVAERRLIETVE